MDVKMVTPGKSAGKTIKINEAVFDCAYNEPLLHQVVTTYMARGRAGTKQQKTRSDVSGGGIKPWRQKGSGRARAGTIRSPIWRGGGATFAARPRDFSKIRLPQKMHNKGIRVLWSELFRQERVIVIHELTVDTAKTKAFKQQLAELELTNCLIVSDDISENLYRASGNLPHVQISDVDGLDPVVLLKHEKVLITEAALRELEEKLQ